MSNFLSPEDILSLAPMQYIKMCETAREVRDLDEKMPISWAEAFAKQLKEIQEKVKDANNPRNTVPKDPRD